jgi:methionine-rich copper-binding protein CopC
MWTRNRLGLLALASLTVAVPAAVAATPDKGTVSNSSPSIKWEGTATGYGVVPTNILVTTAGQDPVCEAPACDTFALTVADKADLNVVAAQRAKDNFTELHVVKPDGETLYVQSADSEPARIKVKGAVPGDYTIEVLTNESAEQSGEYDAEASLAVPKPPAPAPAPGAPQPAPAPQPGPAPAPAPAPASAATLGLTTKSVSAKKKAFKLALTSSGPVTNVQVAIRKGKKVLAKGTLKSLNGKGTATAKAKKKLKPGNYVLAVVAKDGARTVGLTAKLKVKK